jgi:hypothetical protein
MAFGRRRLRDWILLFPMLESRCATSSTSWTANISPTTRGLNSRPWPKRIEAVRYAAEVMRDHPTLIWTGRVFRIEVTDGNRPIPFTLVVLEVDAPVAHRR